MLQFNQITINQITLQFQGTVSFSNLTNYPDIKRDSEFLDKMQQNVNNSNTSKLLTPIYLKLGQHIRKPDVV